VSRVRATEESEVARFQKEQQIGDIAAGELGPKRLSHCPPEVQRAAAVEDLIVWE